MQQSLTATCRKRAAPSWSPPGPRSPVLPVSIVVTVPAGTFNKCIKIKIAGRKEVDVPTGTVTFEGESFEWYAPNVGYVKGTFRESVKAPASRGRQLWS